MVFVAMAISLQAPTKAKIEQVINEYPYIGKLGDKIGDKFNELRPGVFKSTISTTSVPQDELSPPSSPAKAVLQDSTNYDNDESGNEPNNWTGVKQDYPPTPVDQVKVENANLAGVSVVFSGPNNNSSANTAVASAVAPALPKTTVQQQQNPTIKGATTNIAMYSHSNPFNAAAVTETVVTNVRHQFQITGKPQDPPPFPVQVAHLPEGELKSPSGEEIVILTGSDSSDTITKQAIKNRAEYAKRHGYSFHFSNFSGFHYEDGRHASWKKIPAFKEAVGKYANAKWFWWLDIDALIMNEPIALAPHLLNEHVLMQRLAYNTHVRFTNETSGAIHAMAEYFAPNEINVNNIAMVISQDSKGLNSGSMFLKRGHFMDSLLDAWELQAEHNFQHRETAALWSIFNQHHALLNYVGIVPQRLINGHTADIDSDGPFHTSDFVLHFGAAGQSCADSTSCVEQWNKYYPQRIV